VGKLKIIDLKEISSSELENVGGKAKGLYLLNSYGLNVPKGFVILDCDIKNDKEEIIAYYNLHNFNKVAVRSSATLEDGFGFSSAGQYDTYLNVQGEEELITSIALCIESCNSETILAYRKAFMQEASKMNVIVMEMVDSYKAGVIFSIDPSSKKDIVLIEAVEGLGENLVSGITTAHEILIDKSAPSFDSEDFLDKSIIEFLYNSTLLIEKQYNSPVDIEWAIDINLQVYFLQLRPITTLNDPTIDELNTKYDVQGDVITNHNVGEMLPGAITPLTISTVVYSIDFGLRKMLKKIGLFKRLKDSPSELLISHYYGHLFFNMRYLYRISKSVLGESKEAVDMGICGKELDIQQVDNFKKKNTITKAFNGIKYAKYMMSYKKALKDTVKSFTKISFDDSSIENLYNSLTDNLVYLNKVLEDHYIVSSHSGAMSSAVFMFLNAELKNVDLAKSQVAYVLEDIDDIESVDILRSMREICQEMLKEYPNALDFTLEEIPDILLTKETKTNDAFQRFINKHGHRCIKESELRNPGWKDDMGNLASYIKSVLPSSLKIKQKPVSNIDSKISEVVDKYKGLKKKILKYLIMQARLGCRNREYSKSKMILVVDKFKTAYRLLADMLTKNSLLPDPDLIYFLQHDELKSLIFDHNSNLIRIALVRRNLFKEQELLKFNHDNLGAPTPIVDENIETLSGQIIQGTALSRGCATGTARVVKSIEDARLIKKGDIMVASYTDIGWSPYFSLISGLITEVGSALSHGAVVAREYAIPLVSNVHFATSKIKTGDTIYIDGTNGTISILDEDI
jgi:pyruvate,water dikinase